MPARCRNRKRAATEGVAGSTLAHVAEQMLRDTEPAQKQAMSSNHPKLSSASLSRLSAKVSQSGMLNTKPVGSPDHLRARA